MFRKDPRQVYLSVALERFPWLCHGFGTRQSHDWPPHQRVASLRQVHSSKAVRVDGAAGCLGEGDALVTDRAGTLLAIRTADCLPVLLVEAERRVVAAVHAGWRGTAGEIVARTVEHVCAGFSGSPAHMHAAIGPGIGPCCYEVGPEVATCFTAWMPALDGIGTAAMLDLAEANRKQLEAAGVPEGQIHQGAPCTCCSENEFHSYRRERAHSGRMISLIGILDDRTA